MKIGQNIKEKGAGIVTLGRFDDGASIAAVLRY
jgi:hypothetical protein